MFVLKADKTQLHVSQREPVTSGSVKVYQARFEFSSDWDGMERVAVFRAGGESRSVLLDDANLCDVPWEVLKQPKLDLMAGVYGSKGGEVVLPTVWAKLGYIQTGCDVGEEAKPPTPDLWQLELAAKQDKLRGQPGQVVGFDEEGNAVPQDASGGGGGRQEWEVVKTITLDEEVDLYEIAALKEYDEIIVTISRPTYVSGLSKNVWFLVLKDGDPVNKKFYTAGLLTSQFGQVESNLLLHVNNLFIQSEQLYTNNPNALVANQKQVLKLYDETHTRDNCILIMQFTDTSVIQGDETVVVYGLPK